MCVIRQAEPNLELGISDAQVIHRENLRSAQLGPTQNDDWCGSRVYASKLEGVQVLILS